MLRNRPRQRGRPAEVSRGGREACAGGPTKAPPAQWPGTPGTAARFAKAWLLPVRVAPSPLAVRAADPGRTLVYAPFLPQPGPMSEGLRIMLFHRTRLLNREASKGFGSRVICHLRR